jgi:hypothetical protein
MNTFIGFTVALVGIDLLLKAPQFLSESKVLEFNRFVEDLRESIPLVVVVDSDVN